MIKIVNEPISFIVEQGVTELYLMERMGAEKVGILKLNSRDNRYSIQA